jgi:hypothetical protein
MPPPAEPVARRFRGTERSARFKSWLLKDLAKSDTQKRARLTLLALKPLRPVLRTAHCHT